MSQDSKLRVGCSGWSYKDWVGPFYPRDTQAKNYLGVYSSVFNSVEIDSSFYRIPNQFMISNWKKITPEDFLFSAKFPKKITHDLKFKEVSTYLSYFYDTMGKLGTKLGPLILQLPPSFKFEKGMKLLENFFSSDLNKEIRHTIEFRHKSWFRQDVYNLLHEYNICLCWSINQYVDTPREITSDFIYARMVGDRSITKFNGIQKNRTEQSKEMFDSIEGSLDSIDDAFVFFNNHFAGFGPESVNEFRRLAGMMEIDWTQISGGKQRSLDAFS
ncbi:MAG: DUF72 domain-containing protein [Nitrososphaerales archaeon]